MAETWGEKLAAFKADPQHSGLATESNWGSKLEAFRQGGNQTTPVPAPESTERYPVGATVGSIAGTVAGAPLGPAGAIGLAALTGAGGEAVQQLYEHATGAPAAPQTATEAATRIGKEFVFQGIADIVGRGVQSSLSALVRRETTPTARQAMSFTQAGMPLQGQAMADRTGLYAKEFLTPGEATGSGYQTILNNVAEGSFLGGGVIENFKVNRRQYLERAMDRWNDQFGQTIPQQELGNAIVGSIQKNYDLNRAPARAVYGFLSQMTEPKPRIVFELEPSKVLDAAGKPIMRKVPKEIIDKSSGAWADMRPLKRFAKDDKRMADFLNGIAADEGGDTLLAKISTMNDYIPYASAQKLRTRLQSVADVFSVENKRAPALGIANKASGMVDEAIDKGLERFSPDARDAWRYANEIYKGASEEYNNEFLRALIKTGTRRKDGLPEKVFDEVWKPGGVSGIQKLKTALDPETWRAFQGKAAQSLVERSTKDGVLDYRALNKLAFGPMGMGDAALRETFGTENLTWFKKFVEAGTEISKKPPSETGKMLIQLTQGGYLMEVAGAGLAVFGMGQGDTELSGAGVAVLLGPAALGKILTTPSLASVFVKGLSTQASSPMSGSIVAKLAQSVIPREEERPKPQVKVSQGVLGLPNLPPPASKVPFTPGTPQELTQKYQRQAVAP